jgi:hypothetical protein
LLNPLDKTYYTNKADVHEQFVKPGKYREAGIRFWELGMTQDAKTQFELSGDKELLLLVEGASEGLNYEILRLLPAVSNNKTAVNLMSQVLAKDIAKLKEKITWNKKN